jgi:hypothetical protein
VKNNLCHFLHTRKTGKDRKIQKSYKKKSKSLHTNVHDVSVEDGVIEYFDTYIQLYDIDDKL